MPRESSLDYDKLVKLVKQNNEITQGEAAQKLGIPIGQVSMLAFCQAKVEAGAVQKAPATQASVKKLRGEGDRWELIAARTGLSVAAVKAHAENAGVLNTYTGRGRNFNGASGGSSRASGKASAKGRPSAKASAKGRPSAKNSAKASPKRQSGKRQAQATTGRIQRTTTKRRSTAGNPS